MMSNLLTHMVEITSHRDHTLLDLSVLSALQELVGASEIRTLEIFRFRNELFMRQRVSTRPGQRFPVDDDTDLDHSGEPVSHFPALLACIEKHKVYCKTVTPDGMHMLWFLIWINDKVNTCVEFTNTAPYSRQSRKVIDGILRVYNNYQNLLDYSERDSLTGLLNRKTFDEKFSRMVATMPHSESPKPEDQQDEQDRRHHADGKEQWLGVVDIDHFKRVNDQFGHLYGDEVLILVANLLRSSFRMQDRIFRFGGEEFVILLRSTTLNEARKIFERFRGNIEQHEFPQVGRVTVSVGFASIANDTPVVILGHADQALYYAKANGRNQVCYYDELVQQGLLHSEISNETAEFFFD